MPSPRLWALGVFTDPAQLGCSHRCRPLYPPCPQTRHSSAALNVALKDLTPSVPSSRLRSASSGVRRSVIHWMSGVIRCPPPLTPYTI